MLVNRNNTQFESFYPNALLMNGPYQDFFEDGTVIMSILGSSRNNIGAACNVNGSSSFLEWALFEYNRVSAVMICINYDPAIYVKK